MMVKTHGAIQVSRPNKSANRYMGQITEYSNLGKQPLMTDRSLVHTPVQNKVETIED